ncbi:protein NYNRIN-like [Morus notabilis]|uniref:protein NYNRIN-like n=1 Tax=Morus notabilis TaxID=981085 RepID=UPI000CED476A|nr:protein NYNRIN-like [Morus notabilis]
MRSPTKSKKVQRLIGCVATLNRFISKATDKCVPFFDALKGSRRFEWIPQCEEAFQKLKEHLGKPPIMSKPNPDEELSVYLSMSQHAVSSVLIREEERVQLPIYYVSKRLLDTELRYSEMECLALALMVASRKLRHYFQSHTIRLYVDGALSDNGSGAGVLLISPEGHKITSAVQFKFKASNNEAEYEALIAGLRLASHLKIERLSIFSDSQLVVGQVKKEYQAHGVKMGAYLRKVKEELIKFKNYEILQIPRAKNANADALAKLASSKDSGTLGVVPIKELERPTIEEKAKALIVQTDENWMTPLIQYLMDAQLPSNKDEARWIRYRAARYLLYDGLLYRRGYSTPLQRCLDDAEAQKVLREIHEGVCSNHTGGQSLALKVLRQGYYCPTLKKDAFQYARRCDKCQSPWPFAKWGVDLIGPLHLAPGGFKFAIVAVDYYTKWAEAKVLTTITEAAYTKFMWDNIVCRFGVPHSIVSDNGKQFDNASTRRFCHSLGIQKDFSVPVHPQSNGQVEAVNKILKYTLKKRLDDLKGKWAEELPKVLWAYRMTSRTTTGETPFSMTYGVEAVLPVEIETPTLRTVIHNDDDNIEGMNRELDLLEEKRLDSQLRLTAYQQRAA